MAMIFEMTHVDEQGNATVLHPMTDVKCVTGLDEHLEKKTEPLLPKEGGKMAGAIDMGQNQIKNLPEPAESNDPVTLGYMENYVTEVILGGEW